MELNLSQATDARANTHTHTHTNIVKKNRKKSSLKRMMDTVMI